MKTFVVLAFAASIAVAGAQVTYVNGTYHCAIANAAYCAFDSLSGNIIIRCNGNVGSPGNCNDNLSGEPPLGVNYAPCFQTSDTSGDAACAKNCIIYGSSGNYHGTSTVLPNCIPQPTATMSSSSTPAKPSTTTSSAKSSTTTSSAKPITTTTTSAKPITASTTTPSKPAMTITTTVTAPKTTLTKTVSCSSSSNATLHSNSTAPSTTKHSSSSATPAKNATVTTITAKNVTTTASSNKTPSGPTASATETGTEVFQGAASRINYSSAGFAVVVGLIFTAFL